MSKSASVELVVVGEVGQTTTPTLAQHAEEIRTLGRRTIADVIEIGRRLTEAKKLCGHGNWLSWLDREFGWSDDTARRFMDCHDLAKNRNLLDLNIPVSGLYLLTAPSTPEEVRTEIIDRAEAGETVTVDDVREAKKKRKPRTAAAPAADDSDRRKVTETFIEMLDLFECGDVDPAARAAFIIEHLDRDIKAGVGKLSIKRLSRAIDVVHIVFREIANDLYSARRSASRGR
jgi:hypothetical protein